MSTTAGAFVAGGLAACGAVTATHPFDTIKIRLQLQGELEAQALTTKKYRGVVHGISAILRTEGIRSLYSGLGCAYTYQILLNGCRLGFYEPLRAPAANALYGDPQVQSLAINMSAGSMSGILGAITGSPFNLIKTRLQSHSAALPVGTQHQYRNAVDGFSKTYQAEGIKGLYRGTRASVLRTGCGSAMQLPTYFWAKRKLGQFGLEEGAGLHLMSSAASGCVVCVCMHPTDTLMARMYNQNGNLYNGLFECLHKTIATEGLLALYKGFFAHLARILPHTILTLTLAEQTNKLVRGLETRLSQGGGDEEIL